jgi:hypothetical protein
MGASQSLGVTLSLPTGCWFLNSSWSPLQLGSKVTIYPGGMDVTFNRHIVTSTGSIGTQLKGFTSRIKGKQRPRNNHEGPERGIGIAVLFL